MRAKASQKTFRLQANMIAGSKDSNLVPVGVAEQEAMQGAEDLPNQQLTFSTEPAQVFIEQTRDGCKQNLKWMFEVRYVKLEQEKIEAQATVKEQVSALKAEVVKLRAEQAAVAEEWEKIEKRRISSTT